MDVPHIDVFVHHIHAEAVAGVQQRLAAGVVRRTDGVVAVLFEKFDLARGGEGMLDRAEDAVVVMDAGAAQDDALAVDAEAVLGVALDLTDAEALFAHVAAEGDAAGI